MVWTVRWRLMTAVVCSPTLRPHLKRCCRRQLPLARGLRCPRRQQLQSWLLPHPQHTLCSLSSSSCHASRHSKATCWHRPVPRQVVQHLSVLSTQRCHLPALQLSVRQARCYLLNHKRSLSIPASPPTHQQPHCLSPHSAVQMDSPSRCPHSAQVMGNQIST